MAGRLSALSAGRTFAPRKILGSHFLLEAESIPCPYCSWEGLGKLKNPMASSGIEHATFRIEAKCLNQLRYRVPLSVEMATCISIKIEEAHEFGETKSKSLRTSDLKHLSSYAIAGQRSSRTRPPAEWRFWIPSCVQNLLTFWMTM
jgi:hypothetical protein